MRAYCAVLALLVVALRAWAMPTITLPSALVPSSGDTIVPFLTPFDADASSLPVEFQDGWWISTVLRFSNWDTRYVDIVIRDLDNDRPFLLSQIHGTSGPPITFATLDRPAGMDVGWGGNGYRVLENEPPRRYKLDFDVTSGHHPMRVSNIWTTGVNYSHMLLLIHGDAIAAAGGTYQLPWMMTLVQFRNPANAWFDAKVDVRGGTFTTVPEPGALAGLAAGAGYLILRTRRGPKR